MTYRVVATRLIVDPHNGRTIAAPAHILAPPRVKQSDIARYGSFDAAREALTRAASPNAQSTPAEAGRGKGYSA